MKKLHLIVPLLIFILSGCASSNSFQTVEYNKNIDHKYPPISVVINNGYANSPRESDIHYGILKALSDSGLFLDISRNNIFSPFVLEIEVDENNNEDSGSNHAKGFFGALTLFMIPQTLNQKFNMKATFRYKNVLVKEYSYTLEGEQRQFLLDDVAEGTFAAMESLVSLLLRDVQKDQIFKHETLTEKPVVNESAI